MGKERKAVAFVTRDNLRNLMEDPRGRAYVAKMAQGWTSASDGEKEAWADGLYGLLEPVVVEVSKAGTGRRGSVSGGLAVGHIRDAEQAVNLLREKLLKHRRVKALDEGEAAWAALTRFAAWCHAVPAADLKVVKLPNHRHLVNHMAEMLLTRWKRKGMDFLWSRFGYADTLAQCEQELAEWMALYSSGLDWRAVRKAWGGWSGRIPPDNFCLEVAEQVAAVVEAGEGWKEAVEMWVAANMEALAEVDNSPTMAVQRAWLVSAGAAERFMLRVKGTGAAEDVKAEPLTRKLERFD